MSDIFHVSKLELARLGRPPDTTWLGRTEYGARRNSARKPAGLSHQTPDWTCVPGSIDASSLLARLVWLAHNSQLPNEINLVHQTRWQ